MQRIGIRDLYQHQNDYIDKEIGIAGWIRSIRLSKKFGFIDINDGSFFKGLQIVFEDNLDNFDDIGKYNTGSAIIASGKLAATPEAKQPFELKADQIILEGASTPDYPLQKKRHSLEYLRSIAHLRPRTNLFSAVFRLRSLAAFAIHQFFQERGFIYVNTPIITASDCEGAGEMFSVSTLDAKNPPCDEQGNVDFKQDFFGKEAHLTVSGQLNGESYAQAFARIYTFGPTFRAENSNTARHAAEFWMIEPEIAFADLNDNMNLAEEMMKFLISTLREKLPEEMEFFDRFVCKGLLERLDLLLSSDFERITYTKAIELLQKSGKNFEYPVSWGADLQTEHERFLTEELFKKPVFVTDYPKEIKAFYMRLNDDQKTVAAMDLLVPGVGEIIGGSQREEREERLLERLRENNLLPEDYWWYLELRKYGTTRHAGFGLGFERFLMYLSGVENIRDVISFPRTVKHADF